jgi:hypothetical protein
MTGNQRAQQGIILIGLMVVLVLAAGATFLQQANRSNAMAIEREAKTMAALLAARDALVAKAVLNTERPGSLPCPDIQTNNPGNNIPGDGKADLLAGNHCPAYEGWLPWRTLDLDDPRDEAGERLWYILSPNFRDDDSVKINSNSIATLNLDGQSDLVALIIAPGRAVGGQTRPSNNIIDYLDDANGNAATSNRDGDNFFFSAPPSTTFNDRIIAIDKTSWLNSVSMRVLGEIRHAVRSAGGYLANPDLNGDGESDPLVTPSVGRFPFRDSAYSLPAASGQTCPSQCWYKILDDNEWFSPITYDRSNTSISVGGRTVLLP